MDVKTLHALVGFVKLDALLSEQAEILLAREQQLVNQQ